MSRFLILFVLLLFSGSLFSQLILSNSNPSIHWKQIENDRYRLIFPEGFSDQAPRYAALLDTLYTLESRSILGKDPQKVSMIVRSGSSISNGFVTLGPRRSEVFTMPPHDYNFLGTNDWLDKVIIHEYRHVVQFDQSNRGFNRLLSVLFGQSAWAGMAFASAPQWFWEGDAVLAETVFTRSGRGRITGYNKEFRSNLLSGRKYHYEKQLLGSYKDFVPNHYVLGSHMVPYVRKMTNDLNIWQKVTTRSFSKSFLPFSFSSSLKKFTGNSVKSTYDKMISDLEDQWTHNEEVSSTSYGQINNQVKSVFTDYNYPQPLADGSIIVQKEGMGDIQKFIQLKEQDENKVFVPGIVNNTGMLSVKAGKVAWTEFNFHPRWRTESYSVIKVYDTETKNLNQLGYHTRYVGADLNEDGILVVTTETDEKYNHTILLLDISGNIIKRFKNTDNSHFTHVRFTGPEELVAIKTNSAGKSLILLNTKSEEQVELIRPGRENFGNPVGKGNWVFFSSGITGVDNIYALNKSDKKRYKVTESKYGAFYPNPDNTGKYLYFNDLGELGLNVAKVEIDPDSWSIFNKDGFFINPLYDASIEQEGVIIKSEELVSSSEPVKNYGPLKGLVNIHSWGPFISSSTSEFDIGIFSRDIMSTTSLFAGYNYNIDENTGKYLGRISFQRFLPIIDLEVSRGDRSISRVTNTAGQNDPPDLQNLNFTWKEDQINLGVRIPLLLTRSKFLTSMEFGYEYAYTGISEFGNNFNSNTSRYYFDLIGDGDLNTNTINFFIFNSLKASKRDVKTRFGQFLSFETTGSFGGDYDAGQTAIRSRWYFPGLGKHHSLSGFWSYQNRDITLQSDNYFLRNRVDLPRGVSVSVFQNFYSMGADYELPILYPDLHIGPFLYLQRIRLTGFFDYGFGNTSVPEVNNFYNSNDYYSTGVELRIDFNAARLLPEIHMGVRYAYDLKMNLGTIELIFPTIDF